MKGAFQTAAEKAAAFDGDPSATIPCLECGRPVERLKLKTPDHLFSKEQHHRRFKAKARSAGRDYGQIVQRAFRDVFHISRGFDYRGKEIRDDMPLLPDDVGLLLAKTGTMEPSRLAVYQQREMDAAEQALKGGIRPEFYFSRCTALSRSFHLKT